MRRILSPPRAVGSADHYAPAVPHRRVASRPPDSAAIAASFAELRENLDVSLDSPTTSSPTRTSRSASRGCRTRTRRRSRSSRSTRPSRWTSTRRSTSSATAAATASATRSPTSPRSSTPGGPMDREAHARGQTLYAPDRERAALSAAALRGRGQPAPGRDAARRRLDDGRRRDRRGRRGRRAPRARAQPGEARLRGRAALARGRHRRRDAPAAPRGRAAPRRSASGDAAGSTCRIPEQEVDRGATATSSRSARRSRSRAGTRRSR